MNSSETSVPASSNAPVAASVEPWQLQANQSDHGETSVVCDAKGLVVCTIPSPVWDVAAVLKHPEDAANARMLVAAPKMLTALREAEKALEVLADEHEQGDDLYEAGGWATDALRVVRKAIRAAEASVGGVASFRFAVNVELRGNDIEAYDNEAACRYARESLEEARGDIDNAEVALGFADGKARDALLSLPSDIEPEASLTDGREGDPDNTMEHGVFEVSVPATVEFDVEAPANASPTDVVSLAQDLLSRSEAVNGVAFDNGCLGTLKLSWPMHIDLVKDV